MGNRPWFACSSSQCSSPGMSYRETGMIFRINDIKPTPDQVHIMEKNNYSGRSARCHLDDVLQMFGQVPVSGIADQNNMVARGGSRGLEQGPLLSGCG